MLTVHSLQRIRERYSIIHTWYLLNDAAPNVLNVKPVDLERKGIRAKLPAHVKGAACAAPTETPRHNSSLSATTLWKLEYPPCKCQLHYQVRDTQEGFRGFSINLEVRVNTNRTSTEEITINIMRKK